MHNNYQTYNVDILNIWNQSTIMSSIVNNIEVCSSQWILVTRVMIPVSLIDVYTIIR